jgi:hypothetical protein
MINSAVIMLALPLNFSECKLCSYYAGRIDEWQVSGFVSTIGPDIQDLSQTGHNTRARRSDPTKK